MKTKKNINPVKSHEHDSRSISNGMKTQILFNKSNINKKKHYKSQTKGNLSSNIYISKYFSNIIFTHIFCLNRNAITKENIANNKFVVNIARFIFFDFLRKGEVITIAASQPADKLIKKSAKTEDQILLMSIIKNVSRLIDVVNSQIDDVRIYNYALTPLQVKTLFNGNSAVRFGPNTGSP